MNEWLMISAMGIGGLCFAIGGIGPKYVRRYIMPLFLGLIGYLAHLPLWQVCAFAVSLSIVLHLGYGDKIPLWRKALTFASYALATLWLGFSWWQLILPPTVLVIYLLSNWKWSSNVFLWKICEFIIGSLIGITVSSLLPR